ncbi:hypothetical protein POTOM_004247 [Populus tomentosa]|uniref:Uncharacterized protein n=1 Tax=Populus tomentosa TaxID=118781 RepID=A0A8X8AK73_POPTO|nr:hypothetical protein POTOM_004247 [Populus tomentosa]
MFSKDRQSSAALTPFALMEAAKFASHWLPFCRRNSIVERCPNAYFQSNHTSSSEIETVKIGHRYGSLVEDYFTGLRLHSEGWRSPFCNPDRPAFLGDAPVSLIDLLVQQKRWTVGVLEVVFLKCSPLTFGFRAVGPLAGLGCSIMTDSSFVEPLPLSMEMDNSGKLEESLNCVVTLAGPSIGQKLNSFSGLNLQSIDKKHQLNSDIFDKILELDAMAFSLIKAY